MSDPIVAPRAVNLKRCTCCNVEKPETEFYKISKENNRLCPTCKDCHSARMKAWRSANQEKVKTINKTYHLANAGKLSERATAWNSAHPERRRTIIRIYGHNRRARKLNAEGTHTAQQVKTLLAKQRGKCSYCKTDIRKKYHVDHIVALAKGGGNDIYNIQLLCPSCNFKKSATDPIEFAQKNGLLL